MATFDSLAEKVLQREPLPRTDLLSVLTSSDDELLDLVSAVFRCVWLTSVAASSSTTW